MFKNSFKTITIPIIERNRMEDQSLPTITDMFKATRQNYDYNVIRTYEGKHKDFAINTKPTKKDHYLDYQIKLNSSPGPANLANQQSQWVKKNPFQVKRAQKQTYLDQIFRREKKTNSPSPNHYSISLAWPKKKDQLKNVSQKTNFADSCQYYSQKIPGPGTYSVRTQIGTTKEIKKFQPHLPIKPNEEIAAEVGSYSPYPLEYNTFARYQLIKPQSQPIFEKKGEKAGKVSKQNQSPGPAAYSTVSFWPGKSPSKKNVLNFFKHLSKGKNQSVYH